MLYHIHTTFFKALACKLNIILTQTRALLLEREKEYWYPFAKTI